VGWMEEAGITISAAMTTATPTLQTCGLII